MPMDEIFSYINPLMLYGKHLGINGKYIRLYNENHLNDLKSTPEGLKALEIIEEVKKELDEEKIPYKDVELGIMIETPAAVMMSEELAQEVDFFSVGTNDLTQYTLAIDRQNPKLDNIYDSHHPAILKMLKMIVDNGHKGGCWVGICGELGADTTLTETFLSMGYDELSVSPSMILKVRQEIRSLDLKA
jgi:phosphotransferase system enzyme I (PtsI)